MARRSGSFASAGSQDPARSERSELHERGRVRKRETRVAGTGPAASWARESLDGHGFRKVSRLIDIVAAPIGDVIREELERHDRENG